MNLTIHAKANEQLVSSLIYFAKSVLPQLGFDPSSLINTIDVDYPVGITRGDKIGVIHYAAPDSYRYVTIRTDSVRITLEFASADKNDPTNTVVQGTVTYSYVTEPHSRPAALLGSDIVAHLTGQMLYSAEEMT